MDPRQILITSKEPPLRVIGWMTESPPKITDGLGGWVEVARPRRRPLTDFQGLPALRMEVPLLLDGHASGEGQEAFIKNLVRMGWTDGSRKTSSIIQLEGEALPIQNIDWVIEAITWGEALWNEAGFRTRQEVTLNVMQYVEDKKLAEVARREQRKPSGSTNRLYVVKAGEHLGEIAARQLGNAQRWKEIAKLNDIRDPENVKKGQKLRMPPK